MKFRPWGLSLVEIMVSLFILVSAFVVFIALSQGMFGSSGKNESRIKAGLVARNHFERIRDWSRQNGVGHPNFDALPGPFAGTISDPDFPEFQITTTITTPNMFNPCSELEAVYPSDPQIHRMGASYRRIAATVRWNSLDPTAQAVFYYLLGSPKRQVRASNPVVVSAPGGIPNPVSSGGCAVNFEASLLDDQNHPIPDVSFHWNVWPSLPIGGDGVVTPDRNGKTATYNCRFTAPDGTSQSIPNSFCYVRAVATYHGIEYAGNSSTIEVGP